MRYIIISLSVVLQSCMLGLGVAHSPEYKKMVDDRHTDPLGVIRVSQKLTENEDKSARITVFAEHMSSIFNNTDNQDGGIGGINTIGVMVEFGN